MEALSFNQHISVSAFISKTYRSNKKSERRAATLQQHLAQEKHQRICHV